MKKNISFLKRGNILKLLPILVLILIPVITSRFYVLSILVSSGIYAMLAIGLSLLLGQAGQISLAVGAFFGIGAYTVAILTTMAHVPSILALIAGAIIAGIIAFIVGKPILRLKSYFLALATLGLGTIFIVMCQQTNAIGGNLGINQIPNFSIAGLTFDMYRSQYYLVWVFALLVLAFVTRSLKSRVGRALKALAVNEVAATSLGINVADWKLRTFVVSSFISGLAGGFYTFVYTAVTPQSFDSSVTMMVMIMVIAGGIDSIIGSVVGAVLITILSNILSVYQQYSSVIYALILILLLLFVPGGLASLVAPGAYQRLRNRFRRAGRKSLSGEGQSTMESAAAVDEETAGAGEALVEDWRSHTADRIRAAEKGKELLKIDDICVFFGGVKAVNEVSLTVKEGLITALIGPNGAGKTTLFNVISGLKKPTKGRIWFKGKEITKMRDVAIARLGIARTFQNLRIFSNMTVLENVMTGRHRHEKAGFITAAIGLQGKEEKESRRCALEKLALVGLAHLADWPVTALPYGQQRLVEIARALATEPELLLLDEPAAGMNGAERVVLVQRIIEIAKSGINVLIVEHDIDLVMGLSDNVFVLDFGKLIAQGTPKEVQQNKAVIEAYIGVKDKSSWEQPGEEEVGKLRGEGRKPMLSIENVSTYYGSIGAVRDVSMKVYPGEILTILGSNGAGKTTLLRTISGALKPRSGKITFMDNDITGKQMQDISYLGIGHVPEGRLVFPTLSVLDNLRLGACRRRNKAEISKDMAFVFELFPVLNERRKQIAGTLSGGQQQMLAIGRALMGKPQLLVLDEPSMGLAPLVVEQIFETLVKLNREQGMTLVIVEQNAEVLSFAHNAVILQTGQVALAGPANELAQDERVRYLYLGQEKGA
jgi:ABC-type branched-subunit amino acid transport system ATPase component/ABC-type branched-subunit amino acid transport system permease subunit